MIKNFIKVYILFLVFCVACTPKTEVQEQKNDYTQYVNPFIGTSGTGHTFPGATTPMGLIQLSPQTGNYVWEYCSGYQYNDKLVQGFTHTHLNGTGVGTLGDVLILPFNEGEAGRDFKVPHSKNHEKASPGYYTTLLSKDDIKAELTATARTGMHRYTFNKGGENKLFINIDNSIYTWGEKSKTKVLDAWFDLEDENTISGFLRSKFWVERQVYFTIELSKPYSAKSFVDDEKRMLVLDYDMEQGEQLEVRVAISTVSIEGAKKNLQAESVGVEFEKMVENAKTEWNKYLAAIEIEGSLEQKENFYTSLYHLYVQPNNITDVDGNYRGANDSVFNSPTGAYYSTLSIWDTYRAAHPLYTILSPKKNVEFIESMLQHYETQGYLPIWTLWGKDNHCMIGNHSVPIIVDAYLKGLPGIDGERAFEAIKTSLTQNSWFKYNWELYDKCGFLPSDKVKEEAVSRTLEATLDDWCAAQMAKKLGKTEDYNFFRKRSENYKNLFDKSTSFMRGRNEDGSWVEPFDPFRISHAGTAGGDYTEGNAWQYTWHVQQDPESLVELIGGKKAFAAKLNTLFSLSSEVRGDGFSADVSGLIGQYAHGNEPSHHVIYLYNYAGQPHKAQKLIPEVLKTQYLNKPDGLSGNDDCGQMSAWYIFSTLGFYPVNPASGVFDIGTPAFKYAKVKVGENTFEVKAPNVSEENIYVQSVKLNGKNLDGLTITYNQIMSGGVLEFEMGNKPVIQ